jgi:hypothetical protein
VSFDEVRKVWKSEKEEKEKVGQNWVIKIESLLRAIVNSSNRWTKEAEKSDGL